MSKRMNEETNASHICDNRVVFLDVVKCSTIILVVWGHLIQYCHGKQYNFWDDWFFRAIYGFHMPLFSLVSGYLFSKTNSKRGTEIAKKKAMQLLLPTVSWALILTFLDIGYTILTHESLTINFVLTRFFIRCISDLWFLKGIFICCMIVLVCERVLVGSAQKISVYLIVIASTSLWPKFFNLHLYGFLVPFYIVGFLIGKSLKKNSTEIKKYKALHISSVPVLIGAYIFLIFNFDANKYIYTSGLCMIDSTYGMLGQLWIDVYRFLTAAVGCLLVISISVMIEKRITGKIQRVITQVSKSTLPIYVMTASAFVYLPKLLERDNAIVSFQRIPELLNVFLLGLSFFIVLCCVLLSRFISKYKIALFLFGKT